MNTSTFKSWHKYQIGLLIYVSNVSRHLIRQNLLCNIFELVFTLCHKCNKFNYLPWKMLNHAGNSYITRRKQLCHLPDTVMSHRIQLYHPLVYLFCILIRSGSRSNVAVAKQRKQRSGIIKRNKYVTLEAMWYMYIENHAVIKQSPRTLRWIPRQWSHFTKAWNFNTNV